MKFPKIHFPICDDNLWTLKIYSFLFEKFWGNEQEVVVMGFEKPDFELPQNFEFVSLAEKQEGGSKKWTRYIHNYLSSIEDEYVIFSLEDFFPIQEPNRKILSELFTTAKEDPTIGRCDISWDSFINGTHNVIERKEGYHLIEVPANAEYRVTTQPSIWRKDFLLRFLNHDWSPWQFEEDGTFQSRFYEDRIIAGADSTFINYATKWIHKGAISRFHAGKVNVLGLDMNTIEELVDNGLVTEEQMQWGQWDGYVPSFSDLGGYKFHPIKMPPHEASLTGWREYWPIYNENKEETNG